MNKLSYGLLSLLSTQASTGYDLTLRINKFWRSTHSAIYPLLAELEEEGYVEFTLIEQNGKPDKKLYILTDKGREALHKWFTDESSDTVVRDETALKLYCIQSMDQAAAENLLNEIEVKYRKKLEDRKNFLEKVSLESEENHEGAVKSYLGAYILTQRAMNENLLGIEWCKWVRKLLKDKDLKFTNQSFMEMGNES